MATKKTITIGSQQLIYTSKVVTIPATYNVEVDFTNGQSILVNNSPTKVLTDDQIKAAYNAKYPAQTGGTGTGTGTGGTIPPPVIIDPKGTPRNITAKDLQNLNGADGEVLIVTDKLIQDQSNPQNCNNTIIDLSATTFTVKGMPAIEMLGLSNGIKFLNPTFEGCDNSCISYKHSLPYDGTLASVVQGLIIQGAKANNSGNLFQNLAAGLTAKGFIGVMSGLQILDLIFKNSPNCGNVVIANGLEDYLMQNIIIDNINTGNSNHNGILMLGGNGICQLNRVTNHQGNAFRLQPYNIMTDSKSVLVTKNTVFNSTRYSAIEGQVMPEDIKAFPGLKPIKSFDVTYNTAGKLSTDQQRNGVMADIYPFSADPTKDVINFDYNLGFAMFALNNQIGNMIASQSASLPKVGTHNIYKANQADAVDANLKSIIAGVGA